MTIKAGDLKKVRGKDNLYGVVGFNCYKKEKCWVAEIRGHCTKHGLNRHFLKPMVKYGNKVTNSYMLDYKKIYEVSDPYGEGRFFLKGSEKDKHISKEEVISWLKTN